MLTLNQMPIVDGLTSTKMIRAYERSTKSQGHSTLAANNGRVPIFAVSASLVENNRETYVEAGFDGWILKPVDFKRLNTLLLGILDDDTRGSSTYVAGEWERGGWFRSRSEQDSAGQDSQDTTPRAEEEKQEMVTDAEAAEQEAAKEVATNKAADEPNDS